jgi:cytochrome P450
MELTGDIAADENRIVIDFDHHGPTYKETWAQSAEERATHTPVAWTNAQGGFWVLSGHKEVSDAVWDPERFASSHNDPEKPWSKGIVIPELPYTLHLSESDPPVHTGRRAVEAPFFTPKSLRKIRPLIDQHLDQAFDEFLDKGEADLASDLAMRTAAMNTIALVGIDPSLWKVFMLSAHQASLLPSNHPDYPLKEIQFVQDKLRELLRDRKENPRDDMLTALAHKTAGGRPLDLETQVGMISAAIFGGFGTVMSTALSCLIWLENHREHYDRILEDDMFVYNMIDEILRVYPPNHGTARTIGQDFELRGQKLRKGDRVMLSWAAANRDPKVFPNPSEVQLDRPNSREHLSFAGGHHRCLGAPLAKLEIRDMLRAVIQRMPDYCIQHDRIVYYPSFANTAGIISMPVTFTPSATQ